MINDSVVIIVIIIIGTVPNSYYYCLSESLITSKTKQSAQRSLRDRDRDIIDIVSCLLLSL